MDTGILLENTELWGQFRDCILIQVYYWRIQSFGFNSEIGYRYRYSIGGYRALGSVQRLYIDTGIVLEVTELWV